MIADHHLAMLAESGIPREHAEARGCETVTDAARLAELGIVRAARGCVPGLLFPLLDARESRWGWQYRPDVPRLREGKPVKYETPFGQHNGIDVPPCVGEHLGDPTVPLFITEGTKKADCAAQFGVVCVSLLGVYGYRGTNAKGGLTTLPDWNDIALNDRVVVVSYDGDVASNPKVAKALCGLADYLKFRGAKVRYLHLPDKDEKVGLDDFLMTDGITLKDLWERVKPEQPPVRYRPKEENVPPGGGGQVGGDGGGPQRLEDAFIGAHIADEYLRGRCLYSKTFHWMRYDGGLWRPTEEPVVAEVIRLALIDFCAQEMRAGADDERRKRLNALLSASRMRGIMSVIRGHLAREGAEFDAHPHLLNAGNGVIDLRDGTLAPHDPDLLFTRATKTDYTPGATHPDWGKALTAVEKEVADWLQLRLGQGLTGYPPPDDVLVVLRGAGENGKSTIVDGVRGGAGLDYAVALADRVLLVRPGDHPTELMTLRDARLAIIEEFAELGHLSVKQLKTLMGTEYITARYCGKDNVTWRATHTPFVTTNYLPRVDESDHGTWRRLAMVEFPYRYRKEHEAIEKDGDVRGDDGLRMRVRAGLEGQHKAVLAWLVDGAVRWYRSGQVMPRPPEAVRKATAAWRETADVLLSYAGERLVFDGDAHVMGKELYEDFSGWLREHGHHVWTDQNFSARLGQHSLIQDRGVRKQNHVHSSRKGLSRRPVSLFEGHSNGQAPRQYAAWLGVRFRTGADE